MLRVIKRVPDGSQCGDTEAVELLGFSDHREGPYFMPVPLQNHDSDRICRKHWVTEIIILSLIFIQQKYYMHCVFFPV